MKKNANRTIKAGRQYTVLQRVLINAALILLNVIVFSSPFAGIKVLSGGAISTIAGFTVIFFSVFVFVKINMISFLQRFSVKYLHKNDEKELITLAQCAAALEVYTANNAGGYFIEDVNDLICQIDKFESKRNKVKNALLKLFEVTEITYGKFSATIDGAETAMIDNLRVLTDRLDIFGGSGYTDDSRTLFKDFAEYITNTATRFDDINLKMDRLLLELTKFGPSNVDGSREADELQRLIDSVKFYME